MADSSGQYEIRGLDIDKIVKGFADKVFKIKNLVTQATTGAREIRWYQKTDPLLTGVTTSGMTSSPLVNVADRARPTALEQSWTRQVSTVQKYMVESPTISMEDIKDSDLDILGTNVRDLVRAVANQVDTAIYNVITENQSPVNILSTAAQGTGWDDPSGGNPVKDLLTAQRKIAEYEYELGPSNVVAVMNPVEYELLVDYILTKGAQWPGTSSQKVVSGVIMELVGCSIVVTTTAPTDSVAVFIRNRAATWKSFASLTSANINDPGIGTKIRCWEEGVSLLTDPKAVHLTTDTIT